MGRDFPRTGVWNDVSTLNQYFVLPKNGSKYYLKYTFLAFLVLGILGLVTPLLMGWELTSRTSAPTVGNPGPDLGLPWELAWHRGSTGTSEPDLARTSCYCLGRIAL